MHFLADLNDHRPLNRTIGLELEMGVEIHTACKGHGNKPEKHRPEREPDRFKGGKGKIGIHDIDFQDNGPLMRQFAVDTGTAI